MVFIFKGELCGRLCDDCEESLSNVQVKLYHLRDDQSETQLATAETKNNFSILSEDHVEAKKKSFIAGKETEEDGRFNIPIKDS